jgi:hypothetical protein
MDDAKCTYCRGVRLVGWSGAGPILCPTCSRDQDAFTVITQAWREQRKAAIDAYARGQADERAARDVDTHALCALILDASRDDTQDVYFTRRFAQDKHPHAWRLVTRLSRKRGEHVPDAGEGGV